MMFNFQIKQDLNHIAILLIAFLAIAYNAFLAFINANMFNIGFIHVVLFEFIIILFALFLILKIGIEKKDTQEILLLFFVFSSTLIISIINSQIFIDSIRNALIIISFVILGRRLDEKTLKIVFLSVSLLVFAFLLIEILFLESFVKIFEPAKYYLSTRGVEISQFNDSGLFNNAGGFEGRFGYGIFDGPRTSSIFLEQVSISNFAIILAIYLTVFWCKIKLYSKFLYIFLILLILLTAESRSALAIVILALFAYKFAKYIPIYWNIFIMPLAIIVVLLIYYSSLPYTFEDTFKGRISHSGYILVNFDISDYLSLDISKLSKYADSGIPYIITSFTVFGFIVFWFYFVSVIKLDGVAQRRFIFLANLYLYSLLMVGAAVFTIKTAALLWLLAGYLSNNLVDEADD